MIEIVGNRSDFVEIRLENRWTGQQTNSVRRAVRWVEPGIFCGIFYLLGCGLDAARRTARLGKGIFSGIFFGAAGGSARRGLTAQIWRAWKSLVFNLWSAWLRLGKQCRIFRWRVLLTPVSDWADFCGREFVWMTSTRWNDCCNPFLGPHKIYIKIYSQRRLEK
jgi:hypothetical protein